MIAQSGDPVAAVSADTTITTTTTTTTAPAPSGGTGMSAATLAAATLPPSPGITNIGGLQIVGVAKVGAIRVAVQGPYCPVQSNEMCYVRPKPGNTTFLNVSTYRTAAVSGPCDVVGASDAERAFPVRNVNEIFIAADAAGDGLLVNIRKEK